MVITFQEGHEERSAAAADDGSDDMREESFEDEDPAPFEDYASDNAGDPEDEDVDAIVELVELMCRAVYTPLNSNISRICGRYCSGPGSCQRRVPSAHAQLRSSSRTRAPPGPYRSLDAVRPGGPPDGLAGSLLTPEELARRQEDRTARLYRDAAELAESSPASTRGYAAVPFSETSEEEIVFQRDETNDPATPTAAQSRVTSAPPALATVNPLPSLTAPDNAVFEEAVAKMTSTVESSVKRVTESFDRKLEDQCQVMRSFQELVTERINQFQEERTKAAAPAPSKAPKVKKKRAKYFAVLRGRCPGLYRTWKEANVQLDKFPGASYMTCKSEAEARRFLAAGADNDSTSEESSDDDSVEEVFPVLRPAATRNSAPSEAMPHERAASHFDSVTHDVSKGNSKELFGKSITVESQVLQSLCPKGVSLTMQEKLAEATLDATSLDGTYSSALDEEKNGDLANLTAALQGTGDSGARHFDTIWKKPSRNPLTRLKDAEGLATLVEKYSRMREPALGNMANDFRNILGVEHWMDSEVDSYLISGMLPSIARWTADYFLELLLKFSLVISQRGWDVVAVDVKFYDTELSNLRATCRRRMPFLYRTYMFLRDARDEGWVPRKLLAERTTYTNSSILELRALLPHLALPGACSHCGSSIHKGSHSQCVFKCLTTAVQAKDAAGRTTAKIATGMGKNVAIADAIKEVQLL
jgi:hypothetical protein